METKIDLEYADRYVVFDISFCSIKKEFSFYNLDRTQSKELVNKLYNFRHYTWKTLAGLERENGLTKEKKHTDSFNMIEVQDTTLQKQGGSQYYFHFRVEKKGVFRVFGFQCGEAFCITHIDSQGKIHHK